MAPRSLFLVASLSVISLGDGAGCSQDPPPKPVEQVSINSGDDDTTTENGNEGDDDSIPVPAAAAAPAQPGAGGAALIAEANRIVGRVRETTYSHKTKVDEASAQYDLDCSGLVDYAMSRVAPDALETLRSVGAKRPLAKHFVELIVNIPQGQKKGRWRRVERAADLAPGDIVSWVKPADVTTNNTGHVMIVRGPVTVGRGEVAVPIIDSTSQRHGSDDSRFQSKATGVGMGTIHIIVNEAGAPTGYRWSNGKKARNHATIVGLGRIE